MAYATYQQVINRYPTISTWNGSQTIVNSDLIYYAEMELNGLLAGHFTVPFSDAHPTVIDLAIDMTYWRAVRFRDKEMAAKVKDGIIGRIDAIKAGREYIYTASGTTIAPSGKEQQVWSNLEDFHPVHGMSDVIEEFVDDDRLDDEAAERL